MEKCEMCFTVKNVKSIKVYNHTGDSFDDYYLCDDCIDNELTQCRNCNKFILSDDICYTDWNDIIPYDDEFASTDERYNIISKLESIFYCNNCKKELFGDKSWKEISVSV